MEFFAALISGLITLFLIIFLLFLVLGILMLPFNKGPFKKEDRILLIKDLEFYETFLKKMNTKTLSISYDRIEDLKIFSNKVNKSSIQICTRSRHVESGGGYTYEKLILIKDEDIESIDKIKNILIDRCNFLKLGLFLTQNEELKFSNQHTGYEDSKWVVSFWETYIEISYRRDVAYRISYDEVISLSVFPERSKINKDTQISIVFKNITTTYIREHKTRHFMEIDKLKKLQEERIWEQKISKFDLKERKSTDGHKIKKNIDGNFMIDIKMEFLRIIVDQNLEERRVKDHEMPELFNRFFNFLEPLCSNAKKQTSYKD